ncbi:MAG: hypothetical protein M3Y54_02520, partial [Bacteroidota bacterium]|nr:hypothetical protein [Bacteroidota bacterium]
LAPARDAQPAASRGDAASKVDFTFTGLGHQNEPVHLRDNDPRVPAPYARFYHSGIMFGIEEPIVELRTSKQGPKRWSFHLLLKGTPTSASLPVVSPQPALVYNGGETSQQAFYPEIMLPPLKQGSLTVQLLPAAKGRMRGTFAGTLTTDKGIFVTISNGSFDLPRLADLD